MKYVWNDKSVCTVYECNVQTSFFDGEKLTDDGRNNMYRSTSQVCTRFLSNIMKNMKLFYLINLIVSYDNGKNLCTNSLAIVSAKTILVSIKLVIT